MLYLVIETETKLKNNLVKHKMQKVGFVKILNAYSETIIWSSVKS